MIHEFFSVANKTIVIAGAGGTVGFRIASYLLQAGAKIAAIDIDPRIEELSAEAKSTEASFRSYICDLTDEVEVEKTAAAVANDFGSVEVLINLVCTFGSGKEIMDQSYFAWKREMDINLNSIFLSCRYFGEKMVIGGGGSIINFASTASYFYVKGSPKAGYCTAKSGVVMLTKSLAYELAEKGIRVNAIAPGFIDIREKDKSENGMRELNKKEKERVEKVPLRRLAKVSDLFGPIVMLASESSSYMTGEVLVVDGGHSIAI